MIPGLIFGLSGLGFIYAGIRILEGKYKIWYLGPRIFPPQAIIYGLIPFGFAGLELCIITLLPYHLSPDVIGAIITLLVLPTTLLGFILAVWRPRWVRPRWVRWLEDNYGDRIHTLIVAARKDSQAWEERVATQEGLEEWAREVAGEPGRKHGLEEH